MDATVADDKIHAVVNLVLHAVDQRLGPVREQLAELTNAMQRSHAELGGRIEECQRLVAALQASGLQASGLQMSGHSDHGGADEPTAQATAHLIEAANVLTDQVAFLEARVNSYTNNRIAEVKTLIDRASLAPSSELISSTSTLMDSAVSASPTEPAAIAAAHIGSAPIRHTADFDNVAPAAARLAPLSRAGNVSITSLAIATPAAPLAGPLSTPLAAPQPVASPSPEPAIQMSDDVARLSAQMSARLAVAVDRALGVVPVT